MAELGNVNFATYMDSDILTLTASSLAVSKTFTIPDGTTFLIYEIYVCDGVNEGGVGFTISNVYDILDKKRIPIIPAVGNGSLKFNLPLTIENTITFDFTGDSRVEDDRIIDIMVKGYIVPRNDKKRALAILSMMNLVD